MKIVKYFFEFVSIISLFCIFKIIGLKNASNLGGILGKYIGPYFRSKIIVKKNIKIAFGNIDKLFFRFYYELDLVLPWLRFFNLNL